MTRDRTQDNRDTGPADSEEAHMSVIGSDIRVKGDIEATADLVVEGKVDGDVRCATLVLGDNGNINGNIDADRVKIAGTVDGEIRTGDLAVEATGLVNGNIEYERLRVATGGEIKGQMDTRPNDKVAGRIGPAADGSGKAAAVFEDPSVQKS